jgi:HEAT repeat protein
MRAFQPISRFRALTAAVLLGATPASATLGFVTGFDGAGSLGFWAAMDDGEGGGGRSAAYRDGQRALDAGDWKGAAETFRRLAAEKGAEADAALYWQAYALGKDGRQTEALAALRELRASYPKSGWLDDGDALEVELRGPRSPVPTGGGAESEELKLYALNGLMQVDSARAIPVLQKFLQGGSSLRLKKQALFVLSQSEAPEAKGLLSAVAHGRTSPGLQREAIEMLGVGGGKESVATLAEIYRESADAEVKEAVLRAFLVAEAEAEVLAIARGDKDPQLRRRAIQQLGAMDAQKQLRELYGTEREPGVRRQILQALGVAGDVEALAQAARTDADPALRRAAIQGLGVAGGPKAGPVLEQIYAASTDGATRHAVIEALFVGDEAAALIRLFRSEKNPELKRDIVQKLSLMDSPEASELLLKMLED